MNLTNNELAIMSLVIEDPKYGYQIQQDIEDRGMREWTEIGFSSIYYILSKLEKKECLNSRNHFNQKGQARKIFQVTPKGVDIMREEILIRLRTPRRGKDDFSLALTNRTLLSNSEIIEALRIYHRDLSRQTEMVKKKAAELPEQTFLLFDHSIDSMQAELNWLEKTIKYLSKQGETNDREN